MLDHHFLDLSILERLLLLRISFQIEKQVLEAPGFGQIDGPGGAINLHDGTVFGE